MNEDDVLPGFEKSGHPVALHEYTGLENERLESDADTSVDFPAIIGLVAMLTGTVCPVAEFTISASFDVPELPLLSEASDTETVNMQLDVRPVLDALYVNDGTLPGSVKSGHVPSVPHEYVGLEKIKPETDADTVVDPPVVIVSGIMTIGTVCPVAGLTVSVGEVPENVLPDVSDAETVNAQVDVMPVAVD